MDQLSPQHDPDAVFRTDLGLARKGDEAALNRLSERHYGRIQDLVHARLARDFRTSRPWLSAKFSTGDIVQDAFSGLHKHLAAFRGSSVDSFIAYMAMVVRNLVLGAVRHHERAQRDARRAVPQERADDAADPGDPPDALLERAEIAHQLRDRLATFEEREALLFQARSEDTASFRELADMLGYSSESAARRAYFRVQADLLLHLSASRPREER